MHIYSINRFCEIRLFFRAVFLARLVLRFTLGLGFGLGNSAVKRDLIDRLDVIRFERGGQGL